MKFTEVKFTVLSPHKFTLKLNRLTVCTPGIHSTPYFFLNIFDNPYASVNYDCFLTTQI